MAPKPQKQFEDKKPCPRCKQTASVAEIRDDEGAIVLTCGCKFGKAALALAGVAEPGLKVVAAGDQFAVTETVVAVKEGRGVKETIGPGDVQTVTAAEVGDANAVLGKPRPA